MIYTETCYRIININANLKNILNKLLCVYWSFIQDISNINKKLTKL